MDSTASNHVPSISGEGWSKALNQCTIQCGGCSATQCWCEGSSTCSKPSPSCNCERTAWPTRTRVICCIMYQWALTASTHSPDSDPIPVPSNIASETEGMTRTGGGSCSELSSNITWERSNTTYCLHCRHDIKLLKVTKLWSHSSAFFLSVLPMQGLPTVDCAVCHDKLVGQECAACSGLLPDDELSH